MTESKLSVGCSRLIEAGWLAAVVITPLFFNMYSRRGFDADKTALLRALVAIMAAAWLIRQLDRRRPLRGWRLTPAAGLALALSGGYGLLALTSIAPGVSAAGSYTRLQGADTLTAYAVLFGLMAHELRTRAQLDRLIDALILTASVVAAYGLIQYAGLDPLWTGNHFGERITSTIGNPIYLGAYLLMTLFVTGGKALICWRSDETHRRRRASLYLALAGLQLLSFIATGSRGPFVGLLAGGFFVLCLLAVLQQRRRALKLIAAIGLIAGGGLIWINLPGSALAAVRELPVIGRFFNLTAANGDSGYARTLIWSGSASLVWPHPPLQFPDGSPDPLNVVRPLIGYGPDTQYLVFQQHYPPALAAETGYGGDTFIGRSHNETWDALVTGGLMGLILYQSVMLFVVAAGLRGLGLLSTAVDRRWLIGLWVAGGLIGGVAAASIELRYLGLGLPAGTVMGLLAYLRRSTRRSSASVLTPDRWLLVVVLAGIIAHYVEIQLGIAVVTSRTLFWVLAALCVALSRTSPLAADAPTREWIGHAAGYAAIAALIGCTLLFAFITNYEQIANPVMILWRALTYNSRQAVESTVVLWLIGGVSMTAAALAQSQLPPSPGGRRAGAALLVVSLALGLTIGFGLLFSSLPGLQPQTAYWQISDLGTYARDRLGLFDAAVGGLAVMLIMLTLSLLAAHRPSSTTNWRRWWTVVVALPIGWLATSWINSANLDAIRADMIYRQGQSFAAFSNWDYALALYQRALTLAPREDTYWRGLGQALIAHAAENAAPARSGGEITAQDILHLNEVDPAALGRLDSLEAARAAFTQAQQLNPLNADHTAGLAETYRQLAEAAGDEHRRADLRAQAAHWYQAALRLRPQDAGLQQAALDASYPQPAMLP